MKRNWAFALGWVNFAVLAMVLIQIASNRVANTRELMHMLAYSLFYANLTGILGNFIASWIFERWKIESKITSNVHKLLLFSALLLAIILLTALGCLVAQTLLMALGFVGQQHFWPAYFQTARTAMLLASVFALGALVHASLRGRVQVMEKALQEKAVAEERTQKLIAEARLRSLEARIHPHFLFNTLNSISSLTATDPTQAEETVGRLAKLLRASLDSSNQPLISLEQELSMVESYLDIERTRFGDKLRGSVHVPAELHAAKVPPMSVQSLVENAVKHGITPQNGGGEFLVTASADDETLRIEVRDSGPGFNLAEIRAGHGLDSLVQRLDVLFGAKACLSVFRKDGYSVVEMVLPRV